MARAAAPGVAGSPFPPCRRTSDARLDEDSDVIGPSPPVPGLVLDGTALTSLTETGAFLRLCYVMTRNGDSIEQCLPLTEDCSKPAPVEST